MPVRETTETDPPAQATVYLPEGKWLWYEAGKSYRIEIMNDENGCVSVLRDMTLIEVVESSDDARLTFVQSVRAAND